MMAVLRSRNM